MKLKYFITIALLLFTQNSYSRSLVANKWNCMKITDVSNEYLSAVSKKLQESKRDILLTPVEN